MRIELDQTLWARVQRHAQTAGYSSPEEFVKHAIEIQLMQTEPAEGEGAAAAKVRGIGYLDAGLDI